ncbi:hypothetical protein ABIE78_003919 [Sinorhizobium fredii]|uniref:Uncharacterized protein n=1 Tax=Sinorhizobium fredii (strain USDA 257) TaxID=1185652 RepID=I3X327_SINF2|nr:hypothetical protein [Sinorhizobium fredii]AFL50283.1 hypothetical protein USDA257_c16950 [Sinorhizobium fredii USDA 257]
MFIVVAAALAGLGSIATITTTADEIDDQRALQRREPCSAAAARGNHHQDEGYRRAQEATELCLRDESVNSM